MDRDLSSDEEAAIREAVARQTWTVAELSGGGFEVRDAWQRAQRVDIEHGSAGYVLVTTTNGDRIELGERADDLVTAVEQAHWKLLDTLD
jgi:hypothetical protein